MAPGLSFRLALRVVIKSRRFFKVMSSSVATRNLDTTGRSCAKLHVHAAPVNNLLHGTRRDANARYAVRLGCWPRMAICSKHLIPLENECYGRLRDYPLYRHALALRSLRS